MSSFIVETSSINQIVSFFKHAYDFPNNNKYRHCHITFFNRKLCTIGIDILNPGAFIQRMMQLNQLAVNSRYDEFDKTDEAPPFTPSFPEWDEMQVYKSLQCFLYQCAEEKAKDTKLYKILSDLLASWAKSIVSDLPPYNKAEWK